MQATKKISLDLDFFKEYTRHPLFLVNYLFHL